MSAHQHPVKTMGPVRMKLMVTHVLAKVDILESTAKKVSYKIVFKFEMPTTLNSSHLVLTQDFLTVRNGITNLLGLRHASVKQDFLLTY